MPNMLNHKKYNPIVTELFIKGRKLNISLVFITKPYFSVSKNIRLNTTHYFIIKIPSKREIQQIAFNPSSDINFERLHRISRMCKLIMTNGDKIKDKKLQYDKRRSKKISALSLGKTDKYEYLAGEEVLPSNQSGIIE